MSHSPFSTAWRAMWIATSELEHAVCTFTLGPLRCSLYHTRVGRKSLPFARIAGRFPDESVNAFESNSASTRPIRYVLID